MNRKFLGMTFVSGILICGLGTGVAFAQYSKFEYVGEKMVGSIDLVSETFEETMPESGTVYVSTYGLRDRIKFKADANVPADKIMFDVVYNPDRVYMNVNKNEVLRDPVVIEVVVDENGRELYRTDYYDEAELKYEPETVFQVGGYKYTSDMKDFFEIKDDLLNDLKRQRIATYDVIYMDSLTVRVNPANIDKLVDNDW
ncbi:hypothetical protein IMSAG049_01036 [Clostridiales bacterium]|nr:hypothetical protein IMSAG049_01036 [Clostridiales bacterium]